MATKRIAYHLGIAGTVMFLVLMFYGVAIDIPFAHHDTLRYFGKHFMPLTTVDPQDPFYSYSWAIGRPVAAELEDFLFRRISDFSGLSLARLLCAALAGLLAWLAALSFRRLSLGSVISILLGIFVAVLPGLQDRVFMAMPHCILGACSAVGAYLVWTSESPWRTRVLAVFLFLFFALLCYPVVALVFLALLAAQMLWSDPGRWNTVRRQVGWGTLITVVSSVLYLLFVKGVLSQRFPAAAADSHPSYQVTPDLLQLPGKLSLFFNEGMYFVANPFSPYGGVWGGHAVLLFILFCLTRDRSWAWVLRWRRMFIWCLLFLGSVSVWLISPMDQLLYRALYPGMVLCAISLVWAVSIMVRHLGGSKTLARTCLAAMLGVGILGAHQLLTLNVWNANAEMTFIRSQLARAAKADLKRIHVIEPLFTGYGFNGQKVIDDTHNIYSASFWFDYSYLVKMGLWGQITERPLYACYDEQKACVKRTPEGVLLLTLSLPGEAIYPSEEMFVVDFNDLVRASRVFHGSGVR